MNTEHIKLVQESFSTVRPIAKTASELFYARLFQLDPSLKPLFKGDLEQQGRMLMNMLGSAVAGLSNLATLTPVLKDLGARHIHYGVEDRHYATVGDALLWTLEQGLGEQFTEDVHQAWVKAYAQMSSVMMLGAASAQACPPHGRLTPALQ